jgi:thioester reductase-like protein
LLLNSEIARVFTLNRASASSKSQLDRHLDRFRDKDLDLSALQSKKWAPLEGDLAKEDLGLSEAVYKEVCFAITSSQ